MTAAKQLTTVAVTVLLVLSAVATPVLAGSEGGLVDDASDSLTGDGLLDDGTDPVDDTTTTVDDTTTTVEETTDTDGGTDDPVDSDTDLDASIDDALAATSSDTSTSSSTATGSGDGSVDSSASIHDWRAVGSDATHDGVNPNTTGPRVTLGSQWVAGPSAISGSPVVADDTVYAVNDTGTVVALARDGTQQWSVDVTTPTLREAPTVESSPAVDDESVYVTGDGSDGGYVFARSAADGSERWSTAVGSSVRSSPVAVDGTVYVGSAPADTTGALTGEVGPITALDAADGSVVWTNTDLDGEVASSPAVTDSFVYVATVEGTLYKLDRSSGERVDAVGLTGSPIRSAPTVVNGTVYVVADSTVYAAATTDLSDVQISDSLDSSIVGSTVVSDDGVYVASTSGEVVRLNESLAPVDTTTVDERVTASLSMVDGTLYVPTESTVRTLDPDLSPVEEIDTPAPGRGPVTPSAGAGYVGTDDGVFAVHELCDRSAVGADTVRVPTDCATIASAVSAVAPGGTVHVESGTYDETVTISKPVTLRGEGATLDSDYGHEAGLVVASDDVTIDGLAIEEHSTGIRVGAVDDTTVRNVTTRASFAADVELRPAGGTTSNVTIVDSDLNALTGVVLLNASNGGSVADVSVARSTLRSDVGDTMLRATASDGGSVSGVTVRDTRFRKGVAGRFEAGSDGHVADVAIENVTVEDPLRYRVQDGFVFLAAPVGGTATVENVTVTDTTVRGFYTNATRVEAVTTAESGAAVVDHVAVRKTTIATDRDSTGLAVRTSGDASTAVPEVRNVVVTNSRLAGTDTGIEIDTAGVGTVDTVEITDSTVVDNRVGLRLVAGDASDVSVTDSEVAGNADFGVVNDGTGLLDATHNDWGNVSGPFDAASPDTDDAPENPDGTGDAVSDGVTYRPWVSPPEAAIETNATEQTATVSEPVGFESVSTDGFGDVESVEWEFDDGTTATGERVSHAYDATGTYTVTLTVTDSLGDSDTATVQIDVVQEDEGGTPTPTPTETETPTESESPTPTPTETQPGTETPTDSPTPTPTDSPTPTPTDSPTPTPTPTDTATPTESPTSTETATPGSTSTPGESTPTTDDDSSGSGDSQPSSGGSSGGSTGGSSGGVSQSTATPTPSSTDRVVFAGGRVHAITFASPFTGEVSTTELDGLPADVEEQPGTLLGATRITVPPAAEDTAATITFSVPTSMLDAQGVAAEDVQLARYNDGWELLETRVVERTDDRVIFAAETPGFSVFAAVAQPTATASSTATATASPTVMASSTATGTERPTDTPADTHSPTATEPAQMGGDGDDRGGLEMESMVGLGGLLAAILVIAAVRLRRRGDDDVEPAIRS